MTFDLKILGLIAVVYGLAEFINWIAEKRRDIERLKPQYPERCKTCHLYPESCRCEKYSVRTGFNTPDRIRLGRWN